MKSLTPAVWFVAALAAGVANADVKTVTVSAEAAFTGDDAATEKEAKRQARRKAVEEGAGVLVSSNSIMRNYQLIADEIATTAKGVILEEQWGPLEAGKTPGTKQIKLVAKVSPDAIPDSICTVMKQNHDPKVALVFVEKYGDEDKWNAERGLVEAMFTGAFVDACFTIVEAGVKITEISANGDLPKATMDEIIKNADAQYVVLGSAKLLKAKLGADSVLGGGMNSYSLSASLKMINTASSEVEAVATKQLQVMGISPEKALEANDSKVKKNLTGVIMDDLLSRIAKRWTNDLVNTARVSVQVQGMVNYAAAKAFKELVQKTLTGARLEERKVQGGQGSYDIELDGGAEKLAETLEGKKAGKYTIEVIEVARGKVVLKLN
jgi:histone H3/H4